MRLDTERQKELEPKRMENAEQYLKSKGYEITFKDSSRLEFIHKGETVKLYPYSGWHTGKSIKDGRGFQHLIKQLN